jgi:hypothetical protein
MDDHQACGLVRIPSRDRIEDLAVLLIGRTHALGIEDRPRAQQVQVGALLVLQNEASERGIAGGLADEPMEVAANVEKGRRLAQLSALLFAGNDLPRLRDHGIGRKKRRSPHQIGLDDFIRGEHGDELVAGQWTHIKPAAVSRR